ncbi:ABC transporter substrate-binding protein/permease [Nicoliella spurrieriana]|uniref:ABC transporter substrate-binding protein/permease n=1 Tax=Nicoliella spurrieriana TaxID=2925830 RepID=A0A976RR83_9LACO|nr:ABC transporter substrate-binding protein/permease [Nicoliella spurrieriana]UQS86275.1 ABC transporter substrate-binding protein/permease [Nicoliella spurrieriana]
MKGKVVKLLMVFIMTFSIFTGFMNKNTYTQANASDNYLTNIKKKGTIVMGTAPDYPPYEFTKNEGGQAKVMGADIELAKQIAKNMGVKLKIKSMSFDSLLVALQTGKVDMVIAGLTRTPERAKSVDFTIPYYNGGQSLLINSNDSSIKSYKDLANQPVGVQTGSTQYNLVKKQVKNPSIKGMESVNDLVLALKTNKVKAVAVESATGEAYAANTQGIKAIDAKFNTAKAQNVVAFHKGATSLVNAANKTIKASNESHEFVDKFIPTASKEMGTSAKKQKISVWQQMYNYKDYFIKGTEYTILISIIGTILGLIVGILLALMRLSKNKFFHAIAVAYIEFIRGTPLMVQIMFVYFGLGTIVNVPALTSGIIAVFINSGAYVAEIIRSGIESIDDGQSEAARSLGFSNHQTMQIVVLPQAIKNILPALGNEFVSLIKESSIVSIIGVTDLIYQLRIVQADTYQGVVPIFIVMVIYFILTFGISRLLGLFERRLRHE